MVAVQLAKRGTGEGQTSRIWQPENAIGRLQGAGSGDKQDTHFEGANTGQYISTEHISGPVSHVVVFMIPAFTMCCPAQHRTPRNLAVVCSG